jgi:hypothetical protein
MIRSGFLLASFGLGLFLFSISNSHRPKGHRDPAAIRQVFDFSHLRGSALEVAMKQRLLAGLDVIKNDQGFGLSLGHFAFQSANGESTLGCQAFNKVILLFEAEGTAVNGQKTTMEVEGPCQNSADLTKINPMMIPLAQILASEKPGDGDLSFNDKQPISLRFLNVADAWPRKWVLIGVKIESPSQKVLIDRGEVAHLLGQPLIISY